MHGMNNSEHCFHRLGSISHLWICGYAQSHNYAIPGSETPRGHFEHELHSPIVNMWCTLTRVMGSYFFEDIISKQFIPTDVRELYSSAARAMTVLQFFDRVGQLFIMFTLLVTVKTWISQFDGKKEEEDKLCGPLVLLWTFPLGLCESSNIQPKSEHTVWTECTDHCSNCKHYKGHVTAYLARDWLWVGCVQNYRWHL